MHNEQYYIEQATKLAQTNNWVLTEQLLAKLVALIKLQAEV